MAYNQTGRAEAKLYIAQVRAAVVCQKCGSQPIDFHHPEHPANSNSRVAHLVALGFPVARIAAEVSICTPLCRRCHMTEDGRLAALTENRPFKKGMILVGLLPCSKCQTPAKPLRRGLCNRCNHRLRAGTLT